MTEEVGDPGVSGGDLEDVDHQSFSFVHPWVFSTFLPPNTPPVRVSTVFSGETKGNQPLVSIPFIPILYSSLTHGFFTPQTPYRPVWDGITDTLLKSGSHPDNQMTVLREVVYYLYGHSRQTITKCRRGKKPVMGVGLISEVPPMWR